MSRVHPSHCPCRACRPVGPALQRTSRLRVAAALILLAAAVIAARAFLFTWSSI
ncbi:hypothetical protein [Novosphingobium sp. 9]|uniref:hypothetical protein n=1 Tax=Novosphingobium sp. 9 TaxID=2025349 RepID=UPI0021B56796|nr:hypothetical protein [Novosphingobium sp. 9]